ncbi:TetR family transcriptional regulator [Cupriavidus sp. USMAA2-4]|uniref:TetR family transcriptional regulator n=1 Tax=Cupriavidus malaysiensis TaxID=367825 RepID=A0ABM6F491_9BURK|nr:MULTISPECIES: TetR/AcrR family transcriptional regulator [Cupriavidus]AOY90775.1 TetR family transcriptional regulator [Cupriavidus sp. USMAA2-4]AOY99621.1 TetR family transcriptional regulator [Cupriavidus sp. USMAHM13]AOZ06272.1 TetR family transcriptional regulator [Cupriavidus malaysiensis]
MARTADKTDIPNRLTKAGRELFSRLGYNATGIQQITDHAGVPKGSFYNHFESKEAFAAAIIAQYADYLHRSWEAMIEMAPPEPMEAIRYVFSRMIAYHQSRALQAGCLIGNFAAEIALSSEACRAALQAAQLAWRERLAGMIGQAQACHAIRTDISPSDLSGLAWDVWEGALLRMKIERSTEPLRRSVDLMFDHLFQPAAPAAASHRPITE